MTARTTLAESVSSISPTFQDHDFALRREAFFENLRLSRGAHCHPDEGSCAMEAEVLYRRRVLLVADAEAPWTDHDATASQVVTSFVISWNDGLRSNDERMRLLAPFVGTINGSRGSAALEYRRSMRALDWLVRTTLPTWLDLMVATRPVAARLRELPPVVDTTILEASNVVDAVAAARDAAVDAAWSAARSAARDAARDAAGAAAWSAARAAARDAAVDAARDAADAARDATGAAARAAAVDAAVAAARDAAVDAAWSAARSAARDAARDATGAAARAAAVDAAVAALAPTVTTLQASASDLLRELIEMHE